jgi:hypothetical protein
MRHVGSIQNSTDVLVNAHNGGVDARLCGSHAARRVIPAQGLDNTGRLHQVLGNVFVLCHQLGRRGSRDVVHLVLQSPGCLTGVAGYEDGPVWHIKQALHREVQRWSN